LRGAGFPSSVRGEDWHHSWHHSSRGPPKSVRERLHRFRVLQSKQARRVLEDTAVRQKPREEKHFPPTEDREIAGCSILIFLRGPTSPVKRLWAGPKEWSSGTTSMAGSMRWSASRKSTRSWRRLRRKNA